MSRTPNSKRMLRRLRRLHKDRRGIVAVITALSFPLLLAFAALALDVGYLQDMKRRQKNAAIAAAFAAGHELWLSNGDTAADTEARAEADRNNFGENDGVTITVSIPPISGPYTGVADHAEVVLERTVPTYFAGVFGPDHAIVRSRAVTGLIKWGDACVVALDPNRPAALFVAGSSTLSTECGIQVNSTANNALFLAGNAVCVDGSTMIGVTGGVFSAGGSPCISPTPIQAPPINDPLDYMHDYAPAAGACGPANVDYYNRLIVSSDGVVDLSPGTYCAGSAMGFKTDPETGITRGGMIPVPAIRIQGGVVNFAPGVYFLLGGMSITGPAVVRGTDVTFYNTSTSPNMFMSWGEFVIAGDANVRLSAPTSGYFEGVLFWDDEDAPDRRPSHMFVGSSASAFGGALYFKETQVTYGGAANTADWAMIIADTIDVVGTAFVPGDASINTGDILPPTRKVTLME